MQGRNCERMSKHICFALGWVRSLCVRFGISWCRSTVKKDLRKKVETYLVYVRLGYGGLITFFRDTLVWVGAQTP